jgi:hypothetical protein
LNNLSAITVVGDCLWTASDEGRTIECLAPHRDGYRVHGQMKLDDAFAGIPGAARQDEVDIESLDFALDRLWICGSHCLVRRRSKSTTPGKVDSRFRSRKSRRLLGCVSTTATLDPKDPPGQALPFSGGGSLRDALSRNPYIAPFVGLPSKDNGLDIEGMALVGRKILLGLRGPTVDSIALVVETSVRTRPRLRLDRSVTHFLDLEGLGIRDLARWRGEIVVLAGPVTSAPGPFRLYRWKPRRQRRTQTPEQVYEWPLGDEHPEGVCRLDRDGRIGLLVLYDNPDHSRRIRGTRYRADWITGL